MTTNECVLPSITATDDMQAVTKIGAVSALMSAEMAIRQGDPRLANEVGREIIRLAYELIAAYNEHVAQHGVPDRVVLPTGCGAVEDAAVALAETTIRLRRHTPLAQSGR